VTTDPTVNHTGRTANAVLSGDQLRLLNHPSRSVVDWFETRTLATLHATRDQPGVTLTWEAWRRAEQPGQPDERLPWQLGQPLPHGPRYYATLTATLHP
jgi:hypothetical protein